MPPAPLPRRSSRTVVISGIAFLTLAIGGWKWGMRRASYGTGSTKQLVATASISGTAAPVTSPEQALSDAARETDSFHRNQLVQSTLQDWAHRDCDGAATWVLAQPDQERLSQASALLIALADRPDEAVRVAQRLCKEDPHFVREHGDTLVAVLTAAGEFSHAVQFAGQGGPERNTWVSQVFTRWAELAPAAAAEAAIAFHGDDALPAVFATWAAQNRRAAVHFVTTSTVLEPAQRNFLLTLMGPTDG